MDLWSSRDYHSVMTRARGLGGRDEDSGCEGKEAGGASGASWIGEERGRKMREVGRA